MEVFKSKITYISLHLTVGAQTVVNKRQMDDYGPLVRHYFRFADTTLAGTEITEGYSRETLEYMSRVGLVESSSPSTRTGRACRYRLTEKGRFVHGEDEDPGMFVPSNRYHPTLHAPHMDPCGSDGGCEACVRTCPVCGECIQCLPPDDTPMYRKMAAKTEQRRRKMCGTREGPPQVHPPDTPPLDFVGLSLEKVIDMGSD